jgi:ankyrin repeat protein
MNNFLCSLKLSSTNFFQLPFHLKCSIQIHKSSHKSFIRAIQNQKSQINLIKSQIEINPDFLTLTFKSHSALSLAVSNNDINVCRLLLENGADVNFGMPEFSRTPLHIASFYGYLDIIDLLVFFKADIRARDSLGLNCAHFAIDANHFESVKYCVENLGIHTETRDNSGKTSLIFNTKVFKNFSILRIDAVAESYRR